MLGASDGCVLRCISVATKYTEMFLGLQFIWDGVGLGGVGEGGWGWMGVSGGGGGWGGGETWFVSLREYQRELMLRAIFIPTRKSTVEECSILHSKWLHKLDASLNPVTETKQEGGLATRGM